MQKVNSNVNSKISQTFSKINKENENNSKLPPENGTGSKFGFLHPSEETLELKIIESPTPDKNGFSSQEKAMLNNNSSAISVSRTFRSPKINNAQNTFQEKSYQSGSQLSMEILPKKPAKVGFWELITSTIENFFKPENIDNRIGNFEVQPFVKSKEQNQISQKEKIRVGMYSGPNFIDDTFDVISDSFEKAVNSKNTLERINHTGNLCAQILGAATGFILGTALTTGYLRKRFI